MSTYAINAFILICYITERKSCIYQPVWFFHNLLSMRKDFCVVGGEWERGRAKLIYVKRVSS